MYIKKEKYRNRKLLDAVYKVPCFVCGQNSEPCHSNLQSHGKGMGTKASDAAIMALCREHHMMLDQGKDMSKEERRAFIHEAINYTLIYMLENELIEVK